MLKQPKTAQIMFSQISDSPLKFYSILNVFLNSLRAATTHAITAVAVYYVKHHKNGSNHILLEL